VDTLLKDLHATLSTHNQSASTQLTVPQARQLLGDFALSQTLSQRLSALVGELQTLNEMLPPAEGKS
jgi:hypothetical protein